MATSGEDSTEDFEGLPNVPQTPGSPPPDRSGSTTSSAREGTHESDYEGSHSSTPETTQRSSASSTEHNVPSYTNGAAPQYPQGSGDPGEGGLDGENPHCGLTQKIQRQVLGNLERFFSWYGIFVARWYKVVIPASLLTCCLCCAPIFIIGLEQETDNSKLWMADGTDFKTQSDWVTTNYPSQARSQSVIIYTTDGSNILEADKLRIIWKLRVGMESINVNGTTFWNQCRKSPLASRASRPSSQPQSQRLCTNGTMPTSKSRVPSRKAFQCLENHLLSLWAVAGTYPEQALDNLTNAQVLDEINKPQNSFLLGSLGKLTLDKETGRVTRAEAIRLTFLIDVHDAYSADDESNPSMVYEKAYVGLVLQFGQEINRHGLDAVPFATRSFGDIAGEDINSDLTMLSAGFVLVFAFVMIQLGRYNRLEQRAGLSVCGLIAVGMGIGTTYGLCLLSGFYYTTMHTLLPFMLLGIGIDDMFVIVQCFDNLTADEKKDKSLTEWFGPAMRHAGVAITVTTLTDFLAFSIGATTVLPALSSFCVYAAVGIVAVFFYMATFFLAFFSLDQRRAQDRRDGCLCCLKVPENWSPNSYSQKSVLEMLFDLVGRALTYTPVKILVLGVTVGVVGLSCYGVSRIDTDFKREWFINDGTYLKTYFELTTDYFPMAGLVGNVYIAEMDNIHEQFANIQAVGERLKTLEDNVDPNSVTNSVHVAFIAYVSSREPNSTLADFPKTSLSEDQFYVLLQSFLQGPGAKYKNELQFHSEINACDAQAPKIKSLKIKYVHERFDSAMETIRSKNQLGESSQEWHEELFDSQGLLFTFSGQYSNYVTMEIITSELIRNILLALVCVFAATLLLIADFVVSMIVVVNVLFTLVNVGGFMYLWGLTIDTSAAILLTIAMGLAVDYSAHIAHYFMTAEDGGGDRNARVAKTMRKMGPAVFNGGFSTFLAFALLMTSKSYVFITFFKIFFLVVAFGQYHGLVVLPVVLSIIGPAPINQPKQKRVYPITDEANQNGYQQAGKPAWLKDTVT